MCVVARDIFTVLERHLDGVSGQGLGKILVVTFIWRFFEGVTLGFPQAVDR